MGKTDNNKIIRRNLYNFVPYNHRRFVEDTPTIIPILWYANKVEYVDIIRGNDDFAKKMRMFGMECISIEDEELKEQTESLKETSEVKTEEKEVKAPVKRKRRTKAEMEAARKKLEKQNKKKK